MLTLALAALALDAVPSPAVSGKPGFADGSTVQQEARPPPMPNASRMASRIRPKELQPFRQYAGNYDTKLRTTFA